MTAHTPYFNWNFAQGLALSPFFIFQRFSISRWPTRGVEQRVVTQPLVEYHAPAPTHFNAPTGWIHVDDTPQRTYWINIQSDTDVALTLSEQRARLLQQGFKPCRICRGWRSPGQTPAEHHNEEHFGIRLKSSERSWDTDDDDPWIPDVSEYTTSRFERPTPVTSLEIPAERDARRSIAESRRNWIQFRTGQEI